MDFTKERVKPIYPRGNKRLISKQMIHVEPIRVRRLGDLRYVEKIVSEVVCYAGK